VLAGTIIKVDEEGIRLRSPSFRNEDLAVPLTSLAVLWLAVPEGIDNAELLRRKLISDKRARDRVWLRNGDRTEGTLTALDDQGLSLETDKKETRSLKRNQVAMLAFSADARPSAPAGVHARLVLVDGSRLTLTTATSDGVSLTGKTSLGLEVTVPLQRVAGLDFLGGKAVYLSDLKPTNYRHTAYLGQSWPYALDASVAARDLRLGGSTFDKGLGLHSACRISFDVSAGFRRFEALVGLDDQTGRAGNVRIGVLVDGQARGEGLDRDLMAQTGPRRIKVDLAGARELTLVVDFGANGDVQDHVDWCDARLIR
jgi:hypothetical protein